MTDIKTQGSVDPHNVPDVAQRNDNNEVARETTDLPVSTYDDYKSWCEKVRQEWDVN